MSHGTPDWGRTSGLKTTYPMTDLGELAARLGSPITFDRRGDVVFFDSFEDGLSQWAPTHDTHGTTVTPSGQYSRTGGFSVEVALAGNANAYASLPRRQPTPVAGKLGVEYSATALSLAGKLLIELYVYDGSVAHEFSLNYDSDADALSIRTPAGAYTTIATGVNLYSTPGLFHTLKLVVDIENDAYVRAIVDSTTYDLSAYGPRLDANSTTPHTYLAVWVYNDVAVAHTVWLDDLIFTQNEP